MDCFTCIRDHQGKTLLMMPNTVKQSILSFKFLICDICCCMKRVTVSVRIILKQSRKLYWKTITQLEYVVADQKDRAERLYKRSETVSKELGF